MKFLWKSYFKPLERPQSGQCENVRKELKIFLIFFLVLGCCVQCSLGVVHEVGRHRHHRLRHRNNGENSGAPQVGSVILNGKQPVATDSEISYVISVENRRDEKYHLQTNHHPERPETEYPEEDDPPPSPHQIRWADATFEFVRNLDCSKVFFTTEKSCRHLKKQSKSEMTVHIADPDPQSRLAAVLPDGGLSKSGFHDAVVVLDPYPAANYGHLVLVFYVDIHMSESRCQREGGAYLGKYLHDCVSEPFASNDVRCEILGSMEDCAGQNFQLSKEKKTKWSAWHLASEFVFSALSEIIINLLAPKLCATISKTALVRLHCSKLLFFNGQVKHYKSESHL